MQRQPARQLSLRAALAHGLATFRVMVSNFKNFAREHGHFDGHWISQEGKAKEWDQFWNKIQTGIEQFLSFPVVSVWLSFLFSEAQDMADEDIYEEPAQRRNLRFEYRQLISDTERKAMCI